MCGRVRENPTDVPRRVAFNPPRIHQGAGLSRYEHHDRLGHLPGLLAGGGWGLHRGCRPHEAPDVVPDDAAGGSSDPWYWARSEASTTATNAVEILNAYPLMSAELRERRAREEAMAAELRALREVAEAARAFVPEQARVLLGFGKIHPLTRLDSRVAALVDALAKVPR